MGSEHHPYHVNFQGGFSSQDVDDLLNELDAKTCTSERLSAVVASMAQSFVDIRQEVLRFRFDCSSGLSGRWQDFYLRNPDLIRKRSKEHPLLPLIDSKIDSLLRLAWIISEGKVGVGPDGIHQPISGVKKFTSRTRNLLLTYGIERVSDLIGLSFGDVQSLVGRAPGMGAKTFAEIDSFMREKGFYSRSVRFGDADPRGLRPEEDFHPFLRNIANSD